MFIKKYKKLYSKLSFLAALPLILMTFAGFVVSSKASAATVQPAKCAQIQGTDHGVNVSLVPCTGYPIEGGKALPGHCYWRTASSFGYYFKDAGYPLGCLGEPFTSWTAAECSDHVVHQALSSTLKGSTVEEKQASLCAPYGGAYTTDTGSTTADNALTNDFKPDCNTLDQSHCKILNWLIIIINALSALVGLVIVISIIVAGIQWATANSNPQQVAQAKTRIFNAVLAMLVFIFMYAFLQWVVPGGIF